MQLKCYFDKMVGWTFTDIMHSTLNWNVGINRYKWKVAMLLPVDGYAAVGFPWRNDVNYCSIDWWYIRRGEESWWIAYRSWWLLKDRTCVLVVLGINVASTYVTRYHPDLSQYLVGFVPWKLSWDISVMVSKLLRRLLDWSMMRSPMCRFQPSHIVVGVYWP